MGSKVQNTFELLAGILATMSAAAVGLGFKVLTQLSLSFLKSVIILRPEPLGLGMNISGEMQFVGTLILLMISSL